MLSEKEQTNSSKNLVETVHDGSYDYHDIYIIYQLGYSHAQSRSQSSNFFILAFYWACVGKKKIQCPTLVNNVRVFASTHLWWSIKSNKITSNLQ